MNFFECHSKQTCGHMQHASGICDTCTPQMEFIQKSVLICMKMSACMDVSSICMPMIYAIPCTFWKGGHVAIHNERGRVRKQMTINKVPNIYMKDPKTSVPNQLKNKPLKRHGKTVLPQISVETWEQLRQSDGCLSQCHVDS